MQNLETPQAPSSAKSTYARIVADNLEHMSTPREQWRACPITGHSKTTDHTGAERVMPNFEFPAGYSTAPSLFASQEGICQLCGHPIKNYFWIQNDVKTWILAVGSECITHFSEQSGAELSDTKRRADNREVLRQCEKMHALLTAIRSGFIRGQFDRDIYNSLDSLTKLIGNKTADNYFSTPPTTDGPISSWIKKHGAAIAQTIDTARAILLSPDGIGRRIGRLKSEISTINEEMDGLSLQGPSWNRTRIPAPTGENRAKLELRAESIRQKIERIRAGALE